MRKRKQNDFWSEFASVAVTGLVGYAAYKILADNEPAVGQEINTLPSLDKMTLGKAYPVSALNLLDSDLEEKKKHIFDLNAITKGELFVQLNEQWGTLTMTKMVSLFSCPKAVSMVYSLLSSQTFQLDIRNRKPDDDRIWGENTGSSHASLTAPILRQGKTNGSLIVIDRLMDNNSIYHLENEIPFSEAVFTKERNRFGQLEYYRVEYAGI